MRGISDLIVRGVAPEHLADEIIGDLHERRAMFAAAQGARAARAAHFEDVLRSLWPLAAARAGNAMRTRGARALMSAFAGYAVLAFLSYKELPFVVIEIALTAVAILALRVASALSLAFLMLLIVASRVVPTVVAGTFQKYFATGYLYSHLLEYALILLGVAVLARSFESRRRRRPTNIRTP